MLYNSGATDLGRGCYRVLECDVVKGVVKERELYMDEYKNRVCLMQFHSVLIMQSTYLMNNVNIFTTITYTRFSEQKIVKKKYIYICI